MRSDVRASNDIIAVIPARGGSKRLPRKNVLPLAGTPLIVHSIKAAQASRHVTRVIVTTDDDEIARVSEAAGAEVIMRPAALATDNAPTVPALVHAVEEIERNGERSVQHDHVRMIVLLQPTSPLRTAEDIDATIEALEHAKTDAAITAYKFSHPADSLIMIEKGGFTQPLKQATTHSETKRELYRINGAVYALWRDTLMGATPRVFSTSSRIVIMPAERSIDIDEAADMIMAEALLAHHDRRRGTGDGR